MTTLIFPASMPASERYAKEEILKGHRVILASSISKDSANEEIHNLPFIHHPDFFYYLELLIKKCQITKIFTPHVLVHKMLRDYLSKHNHVVTMANNSPMAGLSDEYNTLLGKSTEIITECPQYTKLNINAFYIASILRNSALIYGESSEEKIIALLRILDKIPLGDVVEIGCAWGRSSFVLSSLVNKLNIGNFLAVDPWQAHSAVQFESSQQLQDITNAWDWELMHKGFLINVALVAGDRFNYLRFPSNKAILFYSNDDIVSNEFGRTKYEKEISLIHIDGNHDYDAVKEDVMLWSRFLKPNAWLILDDYIWSHGDGPNRVGNEILSQCKSNIQSFFTAGNALFIHFDGKYDL